MYGIYEGSSVIARFTAPLSVASDVPVFVSDALSLKRNVVKRPAQRWRINCGLEPLTRGSQTLFRLLTEKGNHQTVQVLVPQNYGVSLERTSVSTGVTATGSAGATQVTIANNSGLIPEGSFLKFANHNKIYMVRGNRSGNGAMNIFPELRLAVSATSITYKNDVIGTFWIDTDTISGMQYSDGILMSIANISLLEDV
jgi:hypothetical protein